MRRINTWSLSQGYSYRLRMCFSECDHVEAYSAELSLACCFPSMTCVEKCETVGVSRLSLPSARFTVSENQQLLPKSGTMFVPGIIADPRCLGCLHLHGPQVSLAPQLQLATNNSLQTTSVAYNPIPPPSFAYLPPPPPKPALTFRRPSQPVPPPPPYGHHLSRLSRSSSRASFSSAFSQVAEPSSPGALSKKFDERRRSVTFGELPTEIQRRIRSNSSLPSLKIVEQSDILRAEREKFKEVRDEEIQCNLVPEKVVPKKRAVHKLRLGRVWMTARSPKFFRKNIPEGVVLQTGEFTQNFLTRKNPTSDIG